MVRGVVRVLTNYGAFVEIAEEVDGLVHATDPGLVLLGVPDVGAEVNVRIDLGAQAIAHRVVPVFCRHDG